MLAGFRERREAVYESDNKVMVKNAYLLCLGRFGIYQGSGIDEGL
jgi:hypothetical protein